MLRKLILMACACLCMPLTVPVHATPSVQLIYSNSVNSSGSSASAVFTGINVSATNTHAMLVMIITTSNYAGWGTAPALLPINISDTTGSLHGSFLKYAATSKWAGGDGNNYGETVFYAKCLQIANDTVTVSSLYNTFSIPVELDIWEVTGTDPNAWTGNAFRTTYYHGASNSPVTQQMYQTFYYGVGGTDVITFFGPQSPWAVNAVAGGSVSGFYDPGNNSNGANAYQATAATLADSRDNNGAYVSMSIPLTTYHAYSNVEGYVATNIQGLTPIATAPTISSTGQTLNTISLSVTGTLGN